jgi:hypothetical protein
MRTVVKFKLYRHHPKCRALDRAETYVHKAAKTINTKREMGWCSRQVPRSLAALSLTPEDYIRFEVNLNLKFNALDHSATPP